MWTTQESLSVMKDKVNKERGEFVGCMLTTQGSTRGILYPRPTGIPSVLVSVILDRTCSRTGNNWGGEVIPSSLDVESCSKLDPSFPFLLTFLSSAQEPRALGRPEQKASIYCQAFVHHSMQREQERRMEHDIHDRCLPECWSSLGMWACMESWVSWHHAGCSAW